MRRISVLLSVLIFTLLSQTNVTYAKERINVVYASVTGLGSKLYEASGSKPPTLYYRFNWPQARLS